MILSDRCETRSCSLACVNIHKKAKGCDGKRDKVKFKRKGDMDDLDIVSDFRLLEEVGRGLDQCRRDKIKRSTRQGTEVMRAPRLPRQLMRLQQEARSREVKLQILPPHFVRRKENTTVFKAKMRQIFWKVELVFPHCQAGRRSVSLPAVSERTKVWRLIEEQVEAEVKSDEDDFILYKSLSYGGLSFYLKTEGMTGRNQKKRLFYPLDLKRSLKTNLKGAMIVEHPVIHVVSKAEDMNYREEEEEDEIEESDNTRVESANAAGEIEGDARQGSELGRGDVLSATDAMALDPEGYKRHFDFYLKYYSNKMRLQGGQASSNHPVQMLLGKQSAPAQSAHPVHMLLSSTPPPTALPPAPFSHNVPSAIHSNAGARPPFQPRVPPPVFSANYVPDFNRPPPNFSKPPPPFHNPSSFSASNSNQITPPPSTNSPSLSASNVEAATEIKKELKASAGLGLLSAYCGSDSGSESDSN